MRYLLIISLVLVLQATATAAFGQQSGGADALALYNGWLARESRDSMYDKAHREFEGSGSRHAPPQYGSKIASELTALSKAFIEAFWVAKEYDRAFYIALELEEKLPQVSELEYPDKRHTYLKLGEAYYLFLDNAKSIELLKKALSSTPTSFTDQTNLDALKLIGICYANLGDWQQSDTYFRATLLSGDIVLDRPIYNAYAISHLGCNAMLTGRYDLALELSGAVWAALRQTNDYGHLAGMCYCRGRSYLQKGEFKQASAWADSLVYFAHKDQYNQSKRIKQAYLLKSDYYAAIGDARRSKTYSDSLIGIYKAAELKNTSQYIARAAQEYNSNKIALQAAKLAERRTYIIIVSAIALLGFIISFIILSLYRKRNAAYKALAVKASEWATRMPEQLPPLPTTAITDKDEHIMSLIHRAMANHAYCETTLTAEVLADRLGVHRNTLSRAINTITGSNFKTYINSFRIKEAVRIISQTNPKELHIDELYECVGFGSRSSFNRSFKQFTGLSPLEFHKQGRVSPK